jgi:tellurium resistance protein TerD
MPIPNTLSEVMDAYPQIGDEDLLDAVVTCAALVARADGWVDPQERRQLLDFLERNEFLLLFTNDQVRDTFEQRVRELREPGGAVAALARIGRHAGRASARAFVAVGEQVALADRRIDPRELRALRLIRASLGGRQSPRASSRLRKEEMR